MLFVGDFEGIGSQRNPLLKMGAWRCADSLSLRKFLGVPLTESIPDHSSLTRIRDRLPLETYTAVFQFVLKLAPDRTPLKCLLKGKTVAVESATLEANAVMKSIVRRPRCQEAAGEDWKAYVIRLMKEEGVICKDDQPTFTNGRARRSAGSTRSGRTRRPRTTTG